MKCDSRVTRVLHTLAVALTLAGCGGGGSGSTTTTPPPPPPPPGETINITTDGNVQCVLTVPFTLALQAHGNSGPLTWSVTSGQLPSGLSLDGSSGIISGTPVAGIPITVATVQAADTKSSGSKQFSFTCWNKLSINQPTMVPAHLNAPYSLTIGAQSSGGIANWTISGGKLPPGLSLQASNTATISGVPTQAGTFGFTLQAQDYTIPQTATANISIVVDNHLAITKATLKNGGQNQTYLDSFTAVNGTPPLHWSVSGNFPPGLTVNAASGQVAGMPSNFGGFAYGVSVTDSSSSVESDSGQGILNIAEQLQIVGSLGPAYIGQDYYSGFSAIGGSWPYSWTVVSGSLPSGLSLAQAGDIVGIPMQLGASSFTLQVTDSGSPPYILTQAATLQVVPTLLSVLGDPLSPAPVGVPYHSQVPANGGTPPYSWSISSGQLPLGLALDPSTGNIDGTPTQVGTYNFVARGIDSGNPPQHATANDFIQIRIPLGRNDSIATATPLGNSAALPNPTPLSISPYIDPIDATIPNPDTDYYKLVATGGSAVHVETYAQRTWGADTLDSVLEIVDASGRQYTSCVQPSYHSTCLNDDIDSTTLDSALDFKVPGAATGQTTFYVHVLDWRGDARPDMQYYLNVSGVVEPLTLSPTSLGIGATRGVNYQQQFTSKGGIGNVTWSLAGGSLPTGWTLNSAGMLSGVATTDGSYTFVIKATDSSTPAQTTQSSFTLLIADPVHITSGATWPNACLNQPYTFTMQSTGGIPPIQYTLNGYWIAINNSNYGPVFSGTATALGTYTPVVAAFDSATPPSGQSQTISLTVVTCP